MEESSTSPAAVSPSGARPVPWWMRVADVLFYIPAYCFLLGVASMFAGSHGQIDPLSLLAGGLMGVVLGGPFAYILYVILTVNPGRIHPHPLMEIYMLLAGPMTALVAIGLGPMGGILGALLSGLLAPFLERGYRKLRGED
jgi:hypothetical protein